MRWCQLIRFWLWHDWRTRRDNLSDGYIFGGLGWCTASVATMGLNKAENIIGDREKSRRCLCRFLNSSKVSPTWWLNWRTWKHDSLGASHRGKTGIFNCILRKRILLLCHCFQIVLIRTAVFFEKLADRAARSIYLITSSEMLSLVSRVWIGVLYTI